MPSAEHVLCTAMLARAALIWIRCSECDTGKGGYRSGQTGQTVNLMALPSQVRILHPPLLGDLSEETWLVEGVASNVM